MSADVAVVPGTGERLPTLRGRSVDDIERITDLVFSTVGRPSVHSSRCNPRRPITMVVPPARASAKFVEPIQYGRST